MNILQYLNPKNWFNDSRMVDIQNQYKFQCETNVLIYDPFAFYRNNPIVFAAIDERAKAISNFKFYIETPEGERITDHPLIDFLERPNPYQNRQDYIKSLVTFLSIYGTGNMYANRFVGSQDLEKQSLIILDNSDTSIVQKNDWIFSMLSEDKDKSQISKTNEPIIRYRDPRNMNVIKRLEFSQYLPIFDTPLTKNPLKAESRMKSLLYPISNTQTAFEGKNTLLSNPSGIGILTSDASDANGRIELTPDEHKDAEKDMNLRYGTKTGQTAIRLIRTPMKFQNTAPKFKDMLLDESVVNDGLLIFGGYGLPKELYVALAKGSTFENQSEAFKRYMQTDGQVLADNIASTLQNFYKPKEGKLIASCDHLPAMQEDESKRATQTLTERQSFKTYKETLDDLLEKKHISVEYYKKELNLP